MFNKFQCKIDRWQIVDPTNEKKERSKSIVHGRLIDIPMSK